MNRIILFVFSVAVLVSCKKDKTEEDGKDELGAVYTSDAPDIFETFISIDYDQNDNLTTVKVFFRAEFDNNTLRLLKLPSNSTVKYNGNELTGEYTFEKIFEGKQDALIEFLDFDETLYTNSVEATDTLYFIDLPDTVNSNEDLLIGFGGPSLESDETWDFAFTGRSYGDYYDGVFTLTTDSVALVDEVYLDANESYPITLTRVKKLANPNLPIGGGRVIYRYKITKTIYSE